MIRLVWLLIFIFCFLFWFGIYEALSQPLPLFPNAEGYAMFTSAGRGGRVIKCNTAQQIKKACQDSTGARIVLIPSGGTYDFFSQGGKVTVTHRNLTVACSPTVGDGVLFKNCTFIIDCPEVALINLRIGVGDTVISGLKPETRDGVTIGSDTTYNVYLWHCSVRWGQDENISCGDGAGRVTVSWCAIHNALSNSTHPEGEHSKALMWHNSAGDSVSYMHNFLAHNFDRNAQMVGPGNGDFCNNVVYNFRTATRFGQTSIATHLTDLRNYYRFGLDTPNLPTTGDSTSCLIASNNAGSSLVYAQGNYGFRRIPDDGNEWGITNESTVYQSTTPLAYTFINTQDADSFQRVVDYSGAFPRDNVDSAVAKQFADHTGRIINGVTGGIRYYPTGTIDIFLTGASGDTVQIALGGDIPANRYAGLVFEQTNGGLQTNTITGNSCGSQDPSLCDMGSDVIQLYFSSHFSVPLVGGVATYRIDQTISAPISPVDWDTYAAGTPLTDTDNDGLPNVWEQWFGGTTTSITQSDAIPGQGGYTYMDVYIYTCMDLQLAGLPLQPRYLLKNN